MKKRSILTGVVLVCLSLQLLSQHRDIVVLKTGSEIEGEIIELKTDVSVTISDRCGNRWVFPMDEVDHISKTTGDTGKILPSEYHKGWNVHTTAGFLAGSRDNEHVAPFSILVGSGYRNDFGLYTGLSAGMEFLRVNHLPLLLELEYDLFSTGIRSSLLFRGGYFMPLKGRKSIDYVEYTYSGGWGAAAGMSLKLASGGNHKWYINILYRFMKNRYTEKFDYNDEKFRYTDLYRRLEIRMGIFLD